MSRDVSCRVALVGLAVGLVVVVTGPGFLSPSVATTVDDLTMPAAGGAAAIACLWAARHRGGPERRWRHLIGVGMACWTAGLATWAVCRSVLSTPLPSPSPAGIGFLVFSVLALLALLSSTAPAARGAVVIGSRRRWMICLIDGVIVAGSLFALTWVTTLGAVIGAGAPTAWAFVLAIAHPVADYVLVAVVVALWATKRIPHRMHDQLALLGSGIATLAVADSVCTYRASDHAPEDLSVIVHTCFLLGPALIAVAATLPQASSRRFGPTAMSERATLVLPYVLVGGIWTLITLQNVPADDSRGLVLAGWAVLALLIVRHVCTLLENLTLHRQISATRAELTHQAHHAHHDPLTGLANRTLFDERLRRAIERHRDGCGSVAVLLLDLDDFKSVNDSYGHGCGDDLLRAVGERLCSSVRAGDTAARLGGDEFAVVLEDFTDPTAAAARIHAAVEAPYQLDGRILTIGASVGVAEPGPDEADVPAPELVRRADEAMYEGKRCGKATVVQHRRDRTPVLEV